MLLLDKNSFNLKDTFECGQCFRWEKESENSYIGIAHSKVIRVKEEKNKIIIECDEKDEKIWEEYFDLKRNYEEIKKAVSINKMMEEAVEYGKGIRILKQDFFEALISFIISQQNNISRIKKIVNSVSKAYGEEILFENKTYYAFPTPESLKKATEKDLMDLGAGYRAKYIVKAVDEVINKSLDEDELLKMSVQDARKRLLKLFGVGDKVCDCILLFSLGKYDLFPSDVWIKRVMKENFDTEFAKETGEKMFGKYSGFAQQYLFYWRKNLKAK